MFTLLKPQRLFPSLLFVTDYWRRDLSRMDGAHSRAPIHLRDRPG